MFELLSAAQMKAIEQAAMNSGSATGLQLMERAGHGVVDAILETWPRFATAPARALVLCGPGNNGGDGFVVARLLMEREWRVEVWLLSDDAMPATPDAYHNAERVLQIVDPETENPAVFRPPQEGALGHPIDLVVDAVFGTGLSRAMVRRTAGILGMATATQGAHVVAIDAVSGYCLDSGRWLEPTHPAEDEPFTSSSMEDDQGAPGHADLVVTFHQPKVGHYIGAHAVAAHRLKVVDIGLERRRGVDVGPRLQLIGEDTVPSWRLAKRNGHKYDHGHALILSGGMGRSGAARLAARGALRVGAGLVTVAAPGSSMLECATQLTAIMLRRCEDADDLATLLNDTRLTAVCMGPGLGAGTRTRDLVRVALAADNVAVVLDADALTSFSDAPAQLFEQAHARTVLTPHGGEFARLFPDIADRLSGAAHHGPAFSKVDATRAAAARAGCVVVFKGPDTVIAAPSGAVSLQSAVYDKAAPWLATAGSGDVLAGMITGLLARRLEPMVAAEAAGWVHAEAARAFGPGLTADDLPEMIPVVLKRLAA